MIGVYWNRRIKLKSLFSVSIRSIFFNGLYTHIWMNGFFFLSFAYRFVIRIGWLYILSRSENEKTKISKKNSVCDDVDMQCNLLFKPRGNQFEAFNGLKLLDHNRALLACVCVCKYLFAHVDQFIEFRIRNMLLLWPLG